MTTIAAPSLRGGGAALVRPALHALNRRWFAAVVLVGEAVLLIVTELRHKPWFDEAQAWLLARDTGPLDLLAHHLRYEGSPGLWHLLLMLPAKLGLPYRSMAVFSVSATLAGAAILLFRSPLPRLLAVLVCFSFFAFYQYGVVARNYCLLAPILFLIADGWRSRQEHPLRLAVLLSLLANVSLHGFLIALALATVHALDLRHRWPSLPREERRRQLRAGTLLAVVSATIVAELLPPADLTGGGSWHLTMPWALFGSDLVSRQLLVVIPALIALGVSLWWFWMRRCLLLFALPAGALTLFFMIRYFSPWHAGTLILVWLFALWISLEEVAEPRRVSPRARMAMIAAATLTMAGQVAWTGMSIAYDASNSYSASADIAAYIGDHHLDRSRIDLMGKWGVAILPYFSRDIFHNYNQGHGPSFFPWNTRSPIPGRKSDVLLDRPDYIVVSVKSRDGPSPLACLPGYRQIQAFPGGVYWPGGVMETESFALYQRTGLGSDSWYWGNCGVL